jgi:cob(I)alamin adenosyltransferase
LNRLSDFFFVQARFILHVEGNEEIIWNPSY